MIYRLARICNGYPIFQTPRSLSRADWIEILRCYENWIQPSSPWELLCDPDLPPSSFTFNPQKQIPIKGHIVIQQNFYQDWQKKIVMKMMPAYLFLCLHDNNGMIKMLTRLKGKININTGYKKLKENILSALKKPTLSFVR